MVESLNIIIDRIGQTNVFNIVEGRQSYKNRHLNSLVDDNLIEEFLSEVERLKRISHRILSPNSFFDIDIIQELQYLGETFFDQFFPAAIRNLLRSLSHSFLFFHVDHNLRNIPWELLHDGSDFLANRFYIAKSIAGAWQKRIFPAKERLRMLIIANPTEDLPWAQAEGECLYEVLSEEVHNEHLDIQLLTGRRINKLKLLNAITSCDLVHYAGHMRYDPEEKESIWLLYDQKVLRARETKKVRALPLLIFANCCLNPSPKSEREEDGIGNNGIENNGIKNNGIKNSVKDEQLHFNDMAGALLQTGINNFIGTTSDVKDNSNSSLFALQFYRSIFQEKPLGKALLEARQYAQHHFSNYDLTWANYALHGSPNVHLFRKLSRKPSLDASCSTNFYWRLVKLYPMPIAHAYAKMNKSTSTNWYNEGNGSGNIRYSYNRYKLKKASNRFYGLLETFCITLQTISAIVFSHHIYHNSDQEPLPDPRSQISLRQAVNWIHHYLSSLSQEGNNRFLPRLLEGLNMHHERINCLLEWTEEYLADSIKAAHLESYQIAFKYHLDNLLKDLLPIARFPLLYVPSLQDIETDGLENNNLFLLNGEKPKKLLASHLAPDSPELWELIFSFRGKVCLYIFLHREVIPMNSYLSFDLQTENLSFPLFKESHMIKKNQLLPAFPLRLQRSGAS